MKSIITDERAKTNGSALVGLIPQNGTSGNFEAMAHSAGKAIGKVASRVAHTNNELKAQGREYIQQNPAKSVAFAMAAGLLVGGLFVLARRQRL